MLVLGWWVTGRGVGQQVQRNGLHASSEPPKRQKWKFRFRFGTYKGGTTRGQGVWRDQPGRLVPVRRIPQVLAQLERVLESHHPRRRQRGELGDVDVSDNGRWASGFDRSIHPFWSAKTKSLTIVDQKRKVKRPKDYSRVVQKHKMRLDRNGRRDYPVQRSSGASGSRLTQSRGLNTEPFPD